MLTTLTNPISFLRSIFEVVLQRISEEFLFYYAYAQLLTPTNIPCTWQYFIPRVWIKILDKR